MCELMAARSEETLTLSDLGPLAEGLERHCIAGSGWRVAWVSPDGSLDAYRATSAFRDDPGRARWPSRG